MLKWKWGLWLSLFVILSFLRIETSVQSQEQPDCVGVRNHVQILNQSRGRLEVDLANVFTEVERLRKVNQQLQAALDKAKTPPDDKK